MTELSEIRQKEVSQTVLQQDMIVESATYKQQEISLQKVNSIGFIEKGTGQHQSNTIYQTIGVAPCLNSVNYKEPIKILE